MCKNHNADVKGIRYCAEKKCMTLLENEDDIKCQDHAPPPEITIESELHESICKKCHKIFINFLVNKGRQLSTKCEQCLEIQRAAEERRSFQPRKIDARTKEERASYRKEYNAAIRPDLKYRQKKRDELGDELYHSHNNKIMKIWRDSNPEHCHEYNKMFNQKPEQILKTYKRSATTRRIKFEISDEFAYTLFEGPCFFCKAQKSNGLDRLNNKMNYTSDNTVSCCTACNYMKVCSDPISFYKRIATIIEQNDDYSRFNDYISSYSYNQYSQDSKKRKKDFLLTKDEYYDIKEKNCYICLRPNTDSHTNGIDRIDPALGYTTKNSAPCCGDCNYMKNDFDYQFFKDHISIIYSNFPIDSSLLDPDIIQTKIIVKNENPKLTDEEKEAVKKEKETKKLLKLSSIEVTENDEKERKVIYKEKMHGHLHSKLLLPKL